ncbi:hypothetical protein POM88_008844 [Heracleum sosnowskyi]|uniref:Uncharacterized protein n=1 Tax=Heracleum sosnowskyi TaxID=360622 RepID=A0AAD8JA94_9APIA|nr:hypothetical protein POM88_008844 [Heracleum sosnowskyi]
MARNQNTANTSGGFLKFYRRRDPQNSIPVSTTEHNLVSPPGNDVVVKTDIPIRGTKLKKQETVTDKFSAYIKRVKNGMRSSSSINGAAKVDSRPDSFNDNVSRYIRSAKAKIRRSSSLIVAAGKSVTFK